MRNLMRYLLAVLLTAVCCGVALAGCNGNPKPSPAPVQIVLSGMKTEFEYGEAFSVGDLTVTVKMSDETEYVADGDEYECDSTGYDADTAGEYTITVKLKDSEISQTYKVTVKPEEKPVEKPAPVQIVLSGMKTEFEYGEAFGVGDLTVTVKMSDETEYTADGEDYECDSTGYDADTAGEYTITVKLKDSEISQTYKVTVKPEPVYSWDDDGALKILTIGNSFSDDTMQYVYEIAQSLGINEVYLGNLYIGGCSLDTHASNAASDAPAYEYRVNSNGAWITTKSYKMSDAIASCDWDFVSLQQASGSSGIASTYSKLDYCVEYVKSKLPATAHAKIVWNMTWAYQQNSTHGEFSKYGNSQAVMYSKIVETVQNRVLANTNISAVIPNGTAIQNARTSWLGDTLTRDGYHLTLDTGRYIAGLTLVHALTGLSLENIGYAPSGVSAEIKAIAVESAVNAVGTPYSATPSRYTEEPSLIDVEKYTLLDYELTQGFYNSSDPANYANIITTDANLSHKLFATKRFTEEELPVGSVIILSRGWRYRPEAWKSDAKQSSRPENVTERMVTVTPEWWNGFIFRAFNISTVDSADLRGREEDAKNAVKIYIPKADEETVFGEMGYVKLDFELTQGFYNSTDPVKFANIITTDANLSHKFFATKRFTKEELPVGSVIMVNSGWQYRPECWKADEKQATRPGNTTVVTAVGEGWWEGYLYRAFNIAKLGTPSIEGQSEEAKTAFRIYIPKS